MTEFDPLKRPKTPPKISWFDFLLCPSSLEEHLQKETCEPSACELIALFLYQADLAAVTAKDIAKNEENNDGDRVFEADNKKVRALKALALRVASILNWNLDTLEQGLPLAAVESILLELLSATLPGVEPIAKRHASLDLKALTPEAIFAVLLYHRWCLRTAVKDRFPVKPSKVPKVQVPGLLDPSVQSANKKESILNNVRDGLQDSRVVLEHYQADTPHVILPTLHCFTIVTESNDGQIHDWSLAHAIPQGEVICQINYEMGTLYFHEQDYEKACEMFMDARTHKQKITEPVFCTLDEEELQGYCCACGGVLGHTIPGLLSDQARLVDAIESIRADNFEGLTSVLMQDNQKCVLSLSYRQSLEEDVRAKSNSEGFIQEVVTCNMIRQAMAGRTLPSQYLHMLADNPHHCDFLLDVATGVLKTMDFTQKSSLKHFLRYLSYGLPRDVGFPNKLVDSDLNVLFNQAELDTLMDRWKEERSESPKFVQRIYPESGSDQYDVGQQEHDLFVTYDPNAIKPLVHKLLPKIGKYNLLGLSEKWRLSKDFRMTIDALPVSQSAFSCYVHVMVSKAKVATQLGMYHEARDLLQTSDQAVKDISYKLSKLLRWELLKVDLVQHQETSTLPGGINHADLIKRCKGCITSLQIEHDLQPVGDITALVIAYLLNQKEWEFLSGSTQKSAGYVELGKQISALCKELPQLKNARKYARELWESVTLIFTNSTQQKRTGSGAANNMNRETNLGLVPQQLFIKFCTKLKEQQVLTVIISKLTKLYNILKDDLTVEISSDFLTLWPSTLANTSTINTPLITEAVNVVMNQALTTHPTLASWLRTQADIYYAHSQHAQAIKYYLQVGVVMSDYFTKPISKNIYDENIYRRLIRCCNYLHCHTQIAILCQFLDETDYATAFKAFQERVVHDAMDTYYDCIWDVTLLEFLVNHLHKRGEFDKKQHVLSLIGQPELNSSNPAEILFEAAKLRKARFLRAMAKEYV